MSTVEFDHMVDVIKLANQKIGASRIGTEIMKRLGGIVLTVPFDDVSLLQRVVAVVESEVERAQKWTEAK